MPTDTIGEFTIGFVSPQKHKKNWLFCGLTGSGKTTAAEKVCEISHNYKKYKIISAYDSKQDLESCWCAFPTRGYLKNILATSETCQGVEKEFVTPRGYQTNIFHPLCTRLPQRLPSIFSVFTIPLASIDKACLQFLSETSERSVTLDVLHKLIQSIDPETTLPELLFSLRNSKDSKTKDVFGIESEIASKQMQKTALTIFLPFSTNKILSSSKNPLALTEKRICEIMNDQETFTVFSARYAEDRKTEFFVTLWLLRQLIKLKRAGKIKPDICVSLHDLHILCPRFNTQDYEKVMTNLVFEILTTCRGAGIEVVADVQDPTTLSQRLSGQFSEIYTGFIWSPNELQFFSESGAMLDQWSRWQISQLRYKKQKSFFDLMGKTVIPIIPPLHAHKGEGEDFFETWRQHGFAFKNISTEIEQGEEEFDSGVKKVMLQSKQPATVKLLVKPPRELLQKGKFVRQDVETALDCNNTYAKRAIRNWIELNLVEMKGEARSKNCYYVFNEAQTKK